MAQHKQTLRIALGMFALLVFILILFIAPDLKTSKASGASPYPPPGKNLIVTPTSEPYPAPDKNFPTPVIVTDKKGCDNLKTQLPNGYVVAISSDCQISDFKTQAHTLSKQYEDPKSHELIMYPSLPYSKDDVKSNVEPLRIIGPDDRTEISNTTVFPWTTVVKIDGQFTDTIHFECTGWMLGPSTVVTAGHCVYSFNGTKTYAYNVIFTPALNTDSSNPKPFGSCPMLRGWVLSPWFTNGDRGYDYGVYDLGCTIGYRTGNPGMKVISGSGNGTFVGLPGYPGDKGGTTMWTSGGTVQETQTLLFFYDNDTAESESGAPVWVTEPTCNPCVIAVNAQEYAPPILNSGPRITTEAFNFLLTRQQFIAKLIYLPLCIR